MNSQCLSVFPVLIDGVDIYLFSCVLFPTSFKDIMANENTGGRRYPQNLQGLLQLAVDAGSASDGPAPVEPMSEEVNR